MKYEDIYRRRVGQSLSGYRGFPKIFRSEKPSALEHRHMVISHSQAWNNVAQ